jgi:hypothetical protein
MIDKLADIQVLLCFSHRRPVEAAKQKLHKIESTSNSRYGVFPIIENALERILHEGH